MTGPGNIGVDITWSPGAKQGLIEVVARFPDGHTFTHTVNIVNAVAREKYLDRLCEGRPGVDRAAVAVELERIAAETATERATSQDPTEPLRKRERLLAKADERTAAALDAMSDEEREAAQLMLLDPRLVDLILADIAEVGVVGEQELALCSYVLATSRLLPKPLSAIVQGLTSSGKSFVPSRVGLLIPDEAKLAATDITTNALYYLRPGALMHKFVLAGERRRGRDDDHAEATRALREMQETGELFKVVPMKVGKGGKLQTMVIWQPGPIAYIESTTSTAIFDEDANRAILLGTDESPEQTARIVAAQARAASGTRIDTQPVILRHHALQRSLKRVHVQVPFADAIGAAIPTRRQDARRAMPQILTMIRAVALLYQQQRSDAVLAHGDTIDAALTDYVVARRLLMGPLGRALGGALPTAVAAFGARLKAQFADEVFTSNDALRHDSVLGTKSKVNEYLNVLQQAGVTECLEPARGPKPATWKVVGEVPKGGAMWLPTVEALEGVA